MFTAFPTNKLWSYQVLRLTSHISYGGADLNEIMTALERMQVDDYESWHREWYDLGQRIEYLANESREQERTVTARWRFLRACNYYRVSEFFLQLDDERKNATFLRGTRCFATGGALFNPPLEFATVPFESTTLPALFARPTDGSPPPWPTMVVIHGADGYKEEQYFHSGKMLTERGVAFFVIDGPGQGGPLRLQKLYSRPDYEVAATAAIDYLYTRNDVDRKRIGLFGMSMGGYYAPRAAAFEHRIKALAVCGACYDIREDLFENWPPIQAQIAWLVGAKSVEEARRILAPFNLRGVADKIECPTYVTHGAEDFLVRPIAAQRLYDEIKAPGKRLKIWTPEEGGAGHCMFGNKDQTMADLLDWMAEQLRS